MVLKYNLPRLVMDSYYSYSNTQPPLQGMYPVSSENQYCPATQSPGQYSTCFSDSFCLNKSHDTQAITHQETYASCSHSTDDYARQEFAQYKAYVPDKYGKKLLLKGFGWIPIYSPKPTRTGPISLEPTSTPPIPVHEFPSHSAQQIEVVQTLFSIPDPQAMCPPDYVAKIRDQTEEMQSRELGRLIDDSLRNEQRRTGNTVASCHVKE